MSPRPARTLRRRNGGARARALADTQQGRRQQPRPRAAEIVLALWQAPAGVRKLNRLLPGCRGRVRVRRRHRTPLVRHALADGTVYEIFTVNVVRLTGLLRV
jgi:hypothetical protein